MDAEHDGRSPDRVELRVVGVPAEAVAGPILTAMGARAGLTVQQLDELEMATELLVRGCTGPPVTIVIEHSDGQLRVSVAPIAPSWAERRTALLGELAGFVEVDGERAELRARR
jgi:hypothetical protein